MIRNFLKYSISIIILTLVGVWLMDYILLPNYVGYDNEYYLPDVRNKYLQKARFELSTLGFNVEVITIPFSEEYQSGTVIRMSPRAFTKVKKGRIINLTVAGHKKDILIPNLIGFSKRNAIIEIDKTGLTLDTILYEYNFDIPENDISFQVPNHGQLVKSGALITLGISKGSPPDYYLIPDLVGLSIVKAKEKLIDAGLRIGTIEYEYQPKLLKNTVVDQNFTAGMRVSFPTAVDLIVSKDNE